MPYILTVTGSAGDGVRYVILGHRAVVDHRVIREVEPVLRELLGSSRYLADTVVDVISLPDEGGTVGPLPDEILVEVEPATYDTLIERGAACPDPWGWGMFKPSSGRRPAIIAAYNAKETKASVAHKQTPKEFQARMDEIHGQEEE